MTATSHESGDVHLSDPALEAMLARAAEEGARRALSDVGLGGKDAVLTIHDMKSVGLSNLRSGNSARAWSGILGFPFDVGLGV